MRRSIATSLLNKVAFTSAATFAANNHKMANQAPSATFFGTAAHHSPSSVVQQQVRHFPTITSHHFRTTSTPHPLGDKYKKQQGSSSADSCHEGSEWTMNHEVWTPEETKNVEFTHRDPSDLVDRVAYGGVQMVRFLFDLVSGYKFGRVTEPKLLRRILFLETIAGVPGMVAGSLRHLRSLRHMQQDHGWIHTLLEEAENERMHMLTFMDLYKPNVFFRGAVMAAQGITWNFFFLCYLMCPRLCHRFVGYLEEEAVRTYTTIIEHMDSTDPRDASVVEMGKKPANAIAKEYWKLPETATIRDVMLVVRADEANHRDVNHTFAGMKPDDDSPFCVEKAAEEEKKAGAH